ncbi:hypothetical protein BUALT_Bualt05G0083900 [Buddleja alternifolia]|uniref:Uncharacterized protein n=1 Tax=Buddleja alternifolia TaxID=168488 RepID=A0AAV6XR16_9LAMI|nr:hypothetical protein BUALT_Bualt05G0083900 [Buddleja alternifolia]
MVSEKNVVSVTSQPSSSGLIISTTDAIRSFLTAASTDSHLSEDLRDLSTSLITQSSSSLPYQSLKTIWLTSQPTTRPHLSSLLSGSNFIFTSPKPREKSEELKVRLRKLEEAADRKAYQQLVKDITPKNSVEEPFSSYKDQLGFEMVTTKEGDTGLIAERFGLCAAVVVFPDSVRLHVVLTMFTGYFFGYAAFRALFSHSPAMSAAGGILGLVIGMLVETLLFIVRYSDQDRPSPSSTSSSRLKIKKNQ